MHTLQHALEAGSAVPENGDALITGSTVQGVWDQSKVDSLHSEPASTAPQEPPANEADQYAIEYLARVRAGVAEPGELGALISYLVDESLHHACRRIERAMLGARHG